MRQTELFTKTARAAPRDEMSRNAIWLLRAGYVHKEMAGVYSYLPLGLRVIRKIEQIIREQMNRLGGQEVWLSALQPMENWQKTGRWETMTDLYKIKDDRDRDLALGPTHEEIITPLVAAHLNSYQDLPFAVYQFQTKFRRELRAKSGLLRGREFIMKDLYSFHRDQTDLDNFYRQVKEAYQTIFQTVGIGAQTIYTLAGGGTFSSHSHEFQTITPAGEDRIHICTNCRLAINDEIIATRLICPDCGGTERQTTTGIEVANTFQLGTKFSAAFNLNYRSNRGENQPVIMGCYGLGVSRLLGAIVEITADEQGLAWPMAVAPFRAHLIDLGNHDDKAVAMETRKIYESLIKAGIETFWDDRVTATGIKLADADLLGLPFRLIISPRSVEKQSVEVKRRTADNLELVPIQNLCAQLG